MNSWNLSILHCLFAFLLQNKKNIHSAIKVEQMYNIESQKKLTLKYFCPICTYPKFIQSLNWRVHGVCLQMSANDVVLMVEKEWSSPERVPAGFSVHGNWESQRRLWHLGAAELLSAEPALSRNKYSRTSWGHIQREFSSLVFGTKLVPKWRSSGMEIFVQSGEICITKCPKRVFWYSL